MAPAPCARPGEDRAARTRHAAVAERPSQQRPPPARPRGKGSRRRPAGRCVRSRRRVRLGFPKRSRLASDARIASEKPAILAAATRSASCGLAKIVARGECRGRLDDGEPRPARRRPASAARRCRRRSALLPPRKNGTSAPSARPIGSSRSQRPVEAPEAVQREQRRGGVGAAAAQAGAPGHALVDRDVGAERRAAGRLQRARGAQAQVVGRAARRRGRGGAAGRRRGARSAACRTSRSARTATAAGDSRRRAGRRRAGTGSAWPAPARRRARAMLMASGPVELGCAR